jgi:hypothetical protein
MIFLTFSQSRFLLIQRYFLSSLPYLLGLFFIIIPELHVLLKSILPVSDTSLQTDEYTKAVTTLINTLQFHAHGFTVFILFFSIFNVSIAFLAKRNLSEQQSQKTGIIIAILCASLLLFLLSYIKYLFKTDSELKLFLLCMGITSCIVYMELKIIEIIKINNLKILSLSFQNKFFIYLLLLVLLYFSLSITLGFTSMRILYAEPSEKIISKLYILGPDNVGSTIYIIPLLISISGAFMSLPYRSAQVLNFLFSKGELSINILFLRRTELFFKILLFAPLIFVAMLSFLAILPYKFSLYNVLLFLGAYQAERISKIFAPALVNGFSSISEKGQEAEVFAKRNGIPPQTVIHNGASALEELEKKGEYSDVIQVKSLFSHLASELTTYGAVCMMYFLFIVLL